MALTNDAYELFGGVLHNTPVDETNDSITSQNFKNAQALADKLLAITDINDVGALQDILADTTLINYINSPFVDFLIQYIVNASDKKYTCAIMESNKNALNLACEMGNLKFVKYSAERQANLNEGSVLVAAIHGHLDIIKYLIEDIKADIDQDSYADVLGKACIHGHIDVVKYCVENKIGQLRAALSHAVYYNYFDIVKYLVETDASVLTPREYRLVGFACSNGNLEMLKYFHHHGVILDDEAHAMTLAIPSGHLDVIKYMVEQGGAEINYYDSYTVIRAAQCGQLDIVKYFIEEGAPSRAKQNSAMRSAAEYGRLEVVKYLHSLGVNIHSKNEYAMRAAAANGHLEVVKYLHSCGANIRIMDDYALRWAARYDHLDVVKYLHSHGADIHARNDYPIIVAVSRYSCDVIEWLIEQGADLQVNDNAPLKEAVKRGRPKAVIFLMKSGVDVHKYKDELLAIKTVFHAETMKWFLQDLFKN